MQKGLSSTSTIWWSTFSKIKKIQHWLSFWMFFACKPQFVQILKPTKKLCEQLFIDARRDLSRRVSYVYVHHILLTIFDVNHIWCLPYLMSTIFDVNHIWSLGSLPHIWSLPYLKPTILFEAYHHIWSLPYIWSLNSIWDTPRFFFHFFQL